MNMISELILHNKQVFRHKNLFRGDFLCLTVNLHHYRR